MTLGKDFTSSMQKRRRRNTVVSKSSGIVAEDGMRICQMMRAIPQDGIGELASLDACQTEMFPLAPSQPHAMLCKMRMNGTLNSMRRIKS